MDWNRPDFQRPLLTVLATDLVGSTSFLEACARAEVRLFFSEFSSMTKEIVDRVENQTAPVRYYPNGTRIRFSQINSFVGDGFLTFFAEFSEDRLAPNGPARALVAAKMLRREFRAFCAKRFGGFGPATQMGLRRLKVVSAITHGDVLYGPFASPALPGNTGMLRPIVTAVRLTKIRWQMGAAANATRPVTGDYIVVDDTSMKEIANIMLTGAIGPFDIGSARPRASRSGERLYDEIQNVTFRQCQRNLQGLGSTTFHEAIWPDPPISPAT